MEASLQAACSVADLVAEEDGVEARQVEEVVALEASVEVRLAEVEPAVAGSFNTYLTGLPKVLISS